MRKSILVVIMAVVGLLSASAEAKIVLDKAGAKTQKTVAADWQRHPSSDSYYTEAWTAIMRSKEGHIIYLSFLYSNIGVVSGSSAVSVSLTMPGASSKSYVSEYSTGEFAEDKKIGRIGIASSWAALNGRKLVIKVKEKDIQADFTINSWSDGVKLYNGKMYVSDDKKEWVQAFVHVPRGDVDGSVTVGGKTFKFVGSAYVDHFVQNVLGGDYSSKWWNSRWFGQDYTVAMTVIAGKKDEGGGTYGRMLVVDRKGNVECDDSVSLKASALGNDPKGHKYETVFDITWKGKNFAVSGQFKSQRMNDRESILDRLNAAERAVVQMVAGNPVIYRMDGVGTLTITPTGGAAVNATGPALMETVVLE